jgi:uncharacterized OsmC-like protein
MAQAPGTIHLGKFRIGYEEEREPSRDGREGYFLRQHTVVRLNDVGAGLKPVPTYPVLCDDAQFRKAAGKRPSPLQYFIASLGFCMFSQMARFASRMDVAMDDAEMDVRMTYDLRARKRLTAFATAAQELSYFLKIKSKTPAEKVIRVAQMTDKGCHTVNSMRKRLPISGRLLFNDRSLLLLTRPQGQVSNLPPLANNRRS